MHTCKKNIEIVTFLIQAKEKDSKDICISGFNLFIYSNDLSSIRDELGAQI